MNRAFQASFSVAFCLAAIIAVAFSHIPVARAETVPAGTMNARILPSVWFSVLSADEGSTVDVHAGIQNNSGADFSGAAILYVDDREAGRKEFASKADTLQDVSIAWKATAGQHVFQVKVSVSIPADKDLVSYKTDLAYMSVSASPVTFEDAKDAVAGTASSLASGFVGKADSFADSIVQSLEAAKKVPESAEPAKAVSSSASASASEKPDGASVPERISSAVSSALKSDQAAAVYNAGIDALAFLVHQWRWSLSALAAAGVFLFLRMKAVF